MRLRYKIFIILFLFLSISIFFSNEDKKAITLISNLNENLKIEAKSIIEYLKDITEVNLFDKYKDKLIIKNIEGDIDISEVNKFINYIYSQNIDSFYYFSVKKTEGIEVNIKLYDYLGNILYEKVFLLLDEDFTEQDKYISPKKMEEWDSIIEESSKKIFETREKIFKSEGLFSKFSFEHDFPFINIAVSAVSGKMYFDERMIYKTHKIFSFFPFEIRATVFPVKFFETGLFFKINYNNMVYKYYDHDKGIYDYFEMGLILHYGLFAGFSVFNDIMHYSIGLQIYNMYYDISFYPKWKKADDYRSNFLPQIALYQKVDFKLFKFLYYTIILNFKTIPRFELEDNVFYSRPFLYDFFVIELSFVGFSFMF